MEPPFLHLILVAFLLPPLNLSIFVIFYLSVILPRILSVFQDSLLIILFWLSLMHFNVLLRIKSRGKSWSEAIYIMVSGHLHNGLYQLDVPSSLSQPTGCLHPASHLSLCSSCNKQLLTLWHDRLRHPYPVVLKQIL